MGGYGATPLGDAPGYGAQAIVGNAPAAPQSFGDHLLSAAKNFWDQVNPVTMAQGAADTVMNLGGAAKAYGQRNAELFQKAEDAAKRGDYSEAVAHGLHYLLNGIPGVGSTLDEAADQAKAGDIGGSLGKTAGLAAALIGAPKIPGAAGAAADTVSTAAQAIKEAAKKVSREKVGGALGAGIGAAGGHFTGIPGGGVAGAYVGKELGSAVGKAFEKGPPEAPAAAVPTIPETAPADSMLDDLARSLAGKKFDALSESQQQSIREIAERTRAKPGSAPAPAAAGSPGPAPATARPATPAEPAPTAPSVPPAPPASPVLDQGGNLVQASRGPLTPPLRQAPAPEGAAPEEAPNNAVDFAGAARTKKAAAIARVLDQAGVSHEDFSQLPLKEQQKWLGEIAKALKVNKTGQMSSDSVAETLFELRKLQTAAAGATK